jgi:sigma-B regulation protein RsbU (phosphoserine phosphatase)
LPLLDKINSIVVIGGSISMVILTINRSMTDKGGRVFRAGLIIFVSFIIWTNVAELLGHRTTVELYGFTAFLCCFGYIVAGRVLDRDQQLTSIKQELEIARRIQLSILPSEFPAFEDFAVAVRYAPMTSVAGDFYEFIRSETKGLGLLIADVSGHGVPAALIASMIKVAIQSQRHSMENPDQILAGVNQALCGNTQNQFITAAYVYLDKECGQFHYAAAGHPPMLLLRAGQTSRILENGLVLALMPSAVYTSTSQSLLIGDRLLLYTDGIIEATNAGGEEFGYERLSNLLQVSESKSAEETASMILSAVNDWSPSQSDDLTIIVCDYKRNA